MDVALRRRRRTTSPAAATTVRGQSDAYLDHQPERGGVGGYCAGALWRADVVLPSIGPLEFLALWVHLLQNRTTHAAFHLVEHFVDNLSVLLAMVRESARAPLMQWLYDAVRQCASFQAVAGKLRLGQSWGTVLFMGDAASRGYRDALATLGQRLHVTFEWMPLLPESASAVARTLDAAAALARPDTPPPRRCPRLSTTTPRPPRQVGEGGRRGPALAPRLCSSPSF
jgi:hypothetical protein